MQQICNKSNFYEVKPDVLHKIIDLLNKKLILPKIQFLLSKTICFKLKYSNIPILQLFSEVFGDPKHHGIDPGRAPEILQRLLKIIGIFEYLIISI